MMQTAFEIGIPFQFWFIPNTNEEGEAMAEAASIQKPWLLACL